MQLSQIEETLQSQQWLSGSKPGPVDQAEAKALKASGDNIDVSEHPYAFAWFSLAGKISDAVFAAMPKKVTGEANARHEELE